MREFFKNKIKLLIQWKQLKFPKRRLHPDDNLVVHIATGAIILYYLEVHFNPDGVNHAKFWGTLVTLLAIYDLFFGKGEIGDDGEPLRKKKLKKEEDSKKNEDSKK